MSFREDEGGISFDLLVWGISMFLQIRRTISLFFAYFDNRLKYLVILVKMKDNMGLADVERFK